MKNLFLYLLLVISLMSCSGGGADDGGGNNNPGGGNTPTTPTITLNKSSITFDEIADEEEVSFTSSADWTAEIINDRADSWLSVSPTNGVAGNAKITVKATNNDSTDERSASVRIKAGSAQKTINVTQKQKDALTVTSSKFEIGAEGGEVKIEVKANINFEYEIDASAKDWVRYEGTRAMKTSTLTFIVAENDDKEKREAKITIKSGEFNEVVTIYQAGAEPSIVISQNEYVVSSDGETIAVEVKSNVDVAVELPTDVDWVSENTTRATSTNTYRFDIQPNDNYDQRSTEIKFTNKENNLSEVVKITQAQKDAIVLAKDSYTVESDGGQIQIEIGHNIDFDIEIGCDWITKVENTRAFVTESLIFNIATNLTNDNREGIIIFKSKDGTLLQTVKVYQAQKDALIISDKDIVVSDEGGNISFEIKTNVEFTVSDPDVDWLHIVTTRGLTAHTLNYQVDANISYDSREAQIVVTDTKNNKSETITITQTQKNAIILGSKNIEVNKAGGNIQLEIKANISFSISDPEVDWLREVSTRSLTSYILNYEVDANPSYDSRSTSLVVTNAENNISETIIITQQGGDIVFTLDKSEINFDAQGGSIDVQITSNADWSITNIPSWLSVSKNSGSGSESITFVTSENTLAQKRSAILTFAAMNTTVSLCVNQDAATATIQLGVESIEASIYTGSKRVYLTTNGADWVASGMPDWLTVSPVSGTGSTYVTFSWTENTVAVVRDCNITFSAGDQYSVVNITQAAAPGTISIDLSQKSIESAATEFDVNITTNNSEWYIKEDLSWISVSQTEGINNSTISILCDENLTSSSRYGYIYFYTKDGRQSRSLYVSQAGQYILTLDTTLLTFSGDKATQTIPFTSNSYWYASATESWISLSRTSGSTSYTSINVTAAANNTGVTRSGKVIFRLGDSYTKEVIITQYYIPTLTSSVTELRAPARSSSHSVSIEANTAWNITTDATWCTVAPSTSSGNGEIVISVTENPNYEERTATITITAGEDGAGYTTSTIIVTQNGRNTFGTNDWVENEDQGGVAE